LLPRQWGGWLPGHSYQGNGARGHSTKASEKADHPQKIGDGGASGRSGRRATAALPRKVVAPGAADPRQSPACTTAFLQGVQVLTARRRESGAIATDVANCVVSRGPSWPPSFRDLLAARPLFSGWTATAKRANKQAAALAGQPGSVFWACVQTPNTAGKRQGGQN
jgi:hypothetical protein